MFGNGSGRTGVARSWLACFTVLVFMSVFGCGGPVAEDVAQITGQPVVTPRPVALSGPTSVSRISFQAGTQDLELEMFDEKGHCLVNATTDIVVLAGDFRGRPVPMETPIAFFIASGRGLIDPEALTDENGLAQATFHSLCPTNAADPIAIDAAVRGAEPFTDLNSNGRFDSGEPFFDLDREAFLDADFDGIFEPERNEFMIWDPNHNGKFDPGGNGRYDTDTIIVAHAVIIPVARLGPTPTVTPE